MLAFTPHGKDLIRVVVEDGMAATSLSQWFPLYMLYLSAVFLGLQAWGTRRRRVSVRLTRGVERQCVSAVVCSRELPLDWILTQRVKERMSDELYGADPNKTCGNNAKIDHIAALLGQ